MSSIVVPALAQDRSPRRKVEEDAVPVPSSDVTIFDGERITHPVPLQNRWTHWYCARDLFAEPLIVSDPSPSTTTVPEPEFTTRTLNPFPAVAAAGSVRVNDPEVQSIRPPLSVSSIVSLVVTARRTMVEDVMDGPPATLIDHAEKVPDPTASVTVTCSVVDV